MADRYERVQVVHAARRVESHAPASCPPVHRQGPHAHVLRLYVGAAHESSSENDELRTLRGHPVIMWEQKARDTEVAFVREVALPSLFQTIPSPSNHLLIIPPPPTPPAWAHASQYHVCVPREGSCRGGCPCR